MEHLHLMIEILCGSKKKKKKSETVNSGEK